MFETYFYKQHRLKLEEKDDKSCYFYSVGKVKFLE